MRCRYWSEKGLTVVIATRVLNLAALAFTIAISAFLLLLFDWRALRSECLRSDACDIADVAVYGHPWRHDSPAARTFKAVFLAIFSLYWLYSAMCAALEIRRAFQTPGCKASLKPPTAAPRGSDVWPSPVGACAP